RERGFECTIGAQMLLLPENAAEAYDQAVRLKEIGVDYYVIKPHTQPLYSKTRLYEDFDYEQLLDLGEKLEELNGDGFNVVFRARGMKKTFQPERGYDRCSATPFFWSYIMSDGCVYGCLNYLLNEKFNYGNINETGFMDIWHSEKRRENFEYVRSHLDVSGCRVSCRMDEINQYLWRLSHPEDHDNFI
ncbi:MAG TPA: radical SAM/SPASM domain-containing protein, partial [Nitrospirae bacterium]|nr:radical SAM/SPASM domain-containing protein [Nitrospirota bacterium]